MRQAQPNRSSPSGPVTPSSPHCRMQDNEKEAELSGTGEEQLLGEAIFMAADYLQQPSSPEVFSPTASFISFFQSLYVFTTYKGRVHRVKTQAYSSQ